ncbi:MAG TPA: ABC transporter permease [Mucilaginibacter sp.]|nr:ABC transporter permease [Mucilaginibacter sp.]
MLKNYLKTAWRSLLRNKSYAIINIAGLAVGIAACLLIFLVIQFETSFDDFHKNRDNIYRVVSASQTPDGFSLGSGTPLPTAEGLRVDYPQIKHIASIFRYGGHYTVPAGNGGTDKKFKEDDAYYTEPQFFDIFDFAWLAGDKKTALSEPNTALLTKTEAERFFGNWHDAIGKVIVYENKTNLKITGILEDVPANTDFPLKIVVSYATIKVKGSDFYNNISDWVSTFGSHNVYLILPDNMNVGRFNTELTAFAKKHKPALYAKQAFRLQALKDMHYNTEVSVFSYLAFSKRFLSVLSLIGAFLLVIACVNFINLATAQAVNRSKEVGVRKVLGGSRRQLTVQFISETLIITLFAVVLAAGVAWLMLPLLNQLLSIKISGQFLGQGSILLFLLAVVVCVTLLSGLYPALVLSGFNPIVALKNRVAASRASGISLRRALVVLQFSIAQVLVIGTLVIVYQMDYFRTKSLGFQKDAIVTVPFPGDSVSRSKLNAIRDELMLQPGIRDVSFSFTSPSDADSWSSDFIYNNSGKPTNFAANLKWADAEYFKLYQMQFLAGNAYPKSDTIRAYVVNQTLLKQLGVRNPNDAIGKTINLWNDKSKIAQIVGVVKDFNVSSLKDKIPPVLMASWKDVFQVINIKVQPLNINRTMASIEKIWNNTFPNGLYEYQFLDKKIESFYRTEDQLSTLYKIFAGIAIFISCLGLYGLVSFMALQRVKEVGIRKTLGATVGHIVYLFSREFTVLIIVAFAISAPVGWYFMNKWLQGYTYKIHLGPEIFILAILTSVVIAWATVGYKAIKAALANPVNSLRSE